MVDWLRSALPRGLCVLCVLVLATVLLAACGEVRVSEEPLSTQSLLSAAAEEGTLNILGVDFDPPLDYIDTVHGQGITLLVALENRGRVPVRDVRVVARLYLDADGARAIERDGLIAEMLPGQVVVYRFPRLRSLPLRRFYTLDVRLLTADGRRVLNRRTYTVRVVEEDDQPSLRTRSPAK